MKTLESNNILINMNKLIISIVVILVAGAGLWYWQSGKAPSVSPTPTANTLAYVNNQYGFSIALPGSWQGYKVLNSEWGILDSDVTQGKPIATGPIITLRNPAWTQNKPTEDMPVMVFTSIQWWGIKSGLTHVIGAAPIPPSVLGQNSKYVLALPARYNYDYKTGWQEVDQLVHTLTAFEPTQ